MSRPAKPASPRTGRRAPSLRPGRPVAGDRLERRQLLLDKALDLFSAQGISGTSLHAIAEAAEVTPALVHYYFGSKEKLVEAVSEERFMPIVRQFEALLDVETDDPLGTILAVAAGMVEITSSIPWFPSIWVREVLDEEGHLRQWVLDHVAGDINEKITRLTVSAQRKGKLNPELDPRLMIVSMIGLTLFPLASASIWTNLPGNKGISNAELIRHMLELFKHGIKVK